MRTPIAARLLARVRPAAAAAAALAACALAAPAAHAADAGTYLVKSIDIHQSEEWRSQATGYPSRCKTWQLAEGRSNLGVAQQGTRTLRVERLPFGGGAVGTFDGSNWGVSELRRTLDWRSHVAPDVDECSPCGPSSEYGRCTNAAPPDEVARPRCAPPRGRGLIVLSLTGAGLTVGAVPNLDRELERCPEPPRAAPQGTMQWKLETVRFKEAPQTLARMRLYREHTFRRETTVDRGGGCRRLRGVGFRSCVAYTVVVVVRRIG
ncbi:MAG TPA: hypothetical protein VLK58_22375 [Conexibacter sp.]|nr:hypothetical protein [Conexibacter sp.]